MSTRRPRVKAAAILKPRRPQAATVNEKLVKSKGVSSIEEVTSSITSPLPPLSSTSPSGVEANEPIIISNQESNSDIKPTINLSPNKSNALDDAVDSLENKPPDLASGSSSSKVMPKSANPSIVAGISAAHTPFRRISAPPVNIVNRRKTLIAADNNRPNYATSPKYIKSPSYSFVRDASTPTKDSQSVVVSQSPHHSVKSGNEVDDEVIFSPAPIDNDECFKSPFMSPIYPRRMDFNMSPFHDIYGEDYTKSPSTATMPNNTNNKIRQRIRPTPCFASRRNSIQGSSSSGLGVESEDEQHRRQRHYSTSSNHSNYIPSTTPQHQRNYFGLNKVPSRVRTESYSSSISDIPFSKIKRSHRSEEYQRVANAKREFNQRLNGKPPDKSRLTMYDLIYYNPLTNPMSKPAGKGDKNNDTASISSAKTIQSKSSEGSRSVKSETSTGGGSVKSEKKENVDGVTGPVPQLKLDANGEIILDEKSLVIERTGDKEAREILANSDVIYDDEFSGTSGFYKRQKRTRDWLPLETLKFYRSLQTIGTDFSVMLQLFPNRSRRDLKLKFKKEEKHNMALINKALLHPKEFNVDELKLQFDKEDEEIEQKKQEWAEVRKKMATERREQINASKKRNPNKQVSRSMRNLTEGDMVYENEFVALPPKSKRSNRKRTMIPTDPIDDALQKQNISSNPLYSPLELNDNNNHADHVDSLPQHTYATHKLPCFIEMMSSQSKSRQSTSNTKNVVDTPINECTNDIEDTVSSIAIKSNGIYIDEEESVHAIDLSTTSGSLVIHGDANGHHKNDATIDEHQNTGNTATIDQYIAKNPNLTYKGSRDIMNMDIIFENVSIEEDVTIGSTSNASNDDMIVPIKTTIEETKSDNLVKIDGIQYEIITIDNNNEKECNETSEIEKLKENGHTVDQVIEDIVDVRTIPVISQETYEDSYVYSSNEVIIMDLNDAETNETVEVETFGDDTTITLVDSSSYSTDANSMIHNESDINSTIVETSDVKLSIDVKDELTTSTPIVQANSIERKRKRKIVPVLANKRSKRNNQINETKMVDIPSQQLQSDSRLNENQFETIANDQLASQSDKQMTVDENSYADEQNKKSLHESEAKSVAQHKPEKEPEVETEPEPEPESLSPKVADDDKKEEDGNIEERSFMDSLVVVESQDPNDPNRTIHEVYVVDPETNEMSDKPLDLPDHVIQRIRLSML